METKKMEKKKGDHGACSSKRVAIPGSDRSKVHEEQSNRKRKCEDWAAGTSRITETAVLAHALGVRHRNVRSDSLSPTVPPELARRDH